MSLNLNYISGMYVKKHHENKWNLKHFQEMKQVKIRTVQYDFEAAL